VKPPIPETMRERSIASQVERRLLFAVLAGLGKGGGDLLRTVEAITTIYINLPLDWHPISDDLAPRNEVQT
jgi:hypothetical protein